LCISLFGNVDFDLRQATLEGDVITIFAVAAFAALDVYVPEGVEIDLHGLTAFGHKDAHGSDVEPLPGTPMVRVYAFGVFAGMDVWRVPLAWAKRTLGQVIKGIARGEHRELEPLTAKDDGSPKVLERVEESSGGVSLRDAKVVVSGGRGVGSAEAFSVIEELASLLGAAVGCSRVATSAGWRPHADQVGQTGTKISADLYVACGISGATQHIAGAKGAKRILAINSDPEAPILASADYAVIGDLHEIVPAISAELSRVQS